MHANDKLKKSIRLIILLCSIGLGVILFVPIWRIDLYAPQYPEGLKMLIYAGRLGGNIDIINGLNHYIGMKAIHASDFFEFNVLPYIVVFFAVALLVVAITGSGMLLNIVAPSFMCFGIIAMVDFWRWEYNYGHQLDPEAAIKVPGMTYQPPLLGYKQLLNFGAFSMPGAGGWIFVAVGLTLLVIVIVAGVSLKKKKKAARALAGTVAALAVLFIPSCSTGPEAIVPGKDHCAFCKMTVSDNRFGAEIVTRKGKIIKFDDAHCMLSYIHQNGFDKSASRNIYFINFGGNHSLIDANKALFLHSEELRSPMEGNIAAFDNSDSLNSVVKQYGGEILKWSVIYGQN